MADAPASRIVWTTSSWLMMLRSVSRSSHSTLGLANPSALCLVGVDAPNDTFCCFASPSTMYLWERSRRALHSLTRVAFVTMRFQL